MPSRLQATGAMPMANIYRPAGFAGNAATPCMTRHQFIVLGPETYYFWGLGECLTHPDSYQGVRIRDPSLPFGVLS
jgi:hypothetical protein